jgi:hypothetical protein
VSNLDNIYLKLDLASAASAALLAKIASFCQDNPIRLAVQYREQHMGINLVCQMEGMIVPLREWTVELGVVVHYLRSALDNLIYACAQTVSNPPKRPRALLFPIIENPLTYTKAVQEIAPQLPARIAELLERIQPYQRSKPNVEGTPEQDPLVLLSWISNQDKHRMPVPFFVPPSEINFTHTCEFASEAEASANLPPDVVAHAGPLSNGAILLEYRTKHPVTRVSGQINIAAHIAFETNVGTQEISTILGLLTWYTRLVVDEFAKGLDECAA